MYLPLASALIVLREPCQFDVNIFCMYEMNETLQKMNNFIEREEKEEEPCIFQRMSRRLLCCVSWL